MTKVNGSSGTSIQPTQSTGGVRELKLGNRGADVTALQQQLNQLGYPCDVDGKYGEQTFEAVKAFQAANGLSRVDGIVGSETRGALANPKAIPPNKKDNVNVQQQDDPNKKRNNDILNYPTRVTEQVSTDLENASHDWTEGGYYGDIRKTLAEANTPGDFAAIADAAAKRESTAPHADTIRAIGTANTSAVRLALRDAYADPRANGMAKLTEAYNAARTPADRAAVLAVATKLNDEGLTQFPVDSISSNTNQNNKVNNRRNAPNPNQLTPQVMVDLEKASHDWTASGYFNDIRKTLAEATTPADFRQVADAARKGRLTADHADTIEAIGAASTDAVRLALRDAYANPRENGMNSLAAAQAACRTPADRLALQTVAKRLNAEGLTSFQVSNIRPTGNNNRHNG